MNDKKIKSSNISNSNTMFLEDANNLSENGVLELDYSFDTSDSLEEINRFCDERLKKM